MSIKLTQPKRQQLIIAGIVFLLAILAFSASFRKLAVLEYVGGLLIWTAILTFIQGFQRAVETDRRSARNEAIITLLLGLIYVNAALLKGSAIGWFMLVFFAIDAFAQARLFYISNKKGKPILRYALAALGNLLMVAGILLLKGKGQEWIVAVSGAFRIAGIGLEMLACKLGQPDAIGVDVATAMALPDNPQVRAAAEKITDEEEERAPIDRGWIISFILILFFIHLGRMGFDRSASGILSPVVALIGDLVIALILSFFIILPLHGLLRKSTRPVERGLWKWVLKVPKENWKWYSLRHVAYWWLERRLRLSIRQRKAGYSLATAIRSGLQTGLPFAALLAAIVPVFGMSWYFDTENWAAGIWDGWAANRTDTWRAAMIKSVEPSPTGQSFMLHPQGVGDTADFSFIVIGDPGEGDASQLVLHNQIVKVSEKPEVKFAVISSDVVYPDGAMKDYERKFWLPMHGVSKPVYAIPGNHDWYDALDGFAVTFYDSASAAKTMRARKEVDLNITTHTASSIHDMIAEGARLRKEYGVPTGYQQAPFFQVQTKDFAFICVETGVLRRVDEVQLQWLKQALELAKGKFTMVLLGHPFYAIGEYQGSMNEDFTALHQLLRNYHVKVVMAGDTHDLEYYQEPLKGADSGQVMHHFVNGGGGAYLSIGAAMKAKNEMPEKVWAHYPAQAPLVQKIESHNGWLKRPAWNWTKKYDGWPFSAEWLSAAFDYNVAPFFQSFMEVRVERSQKRIRLLAYTAQGPLTWQELEKSEGVMPTGAKPEDAVEWIFPMQ